MTESPWRWLDVGRQVVLFGVCPRSHPGGFAFYLVRSSGDEHCDGVSFDAGFRGKVRLMCGSGACPYEVDVYVDVGEREVGRVVPLRSEDA